MQKFTIDHVLACPSLPSLPAVAVEVLALTSKKSVQLDEIAQVVQNDQALSAKILKTVNSSFYGLPSPCPTITRAISYLGLSTVKSLVLGFSLVDCTRFCEEGFDLIDYWRRCIYSAAATRSIVNVVGVCDAEEAFTTALMQDIGMPAIHHAIGRDYLSVLMQAAGDHDTLSEIERKKFGFDHAMVGARMAERWRLPSMMIDSIRHHHDPDAATSSIELARAVRLGALAAATLSLPPADAKLAEFCQLAEQWCDLADPASHAVLTEVATQAHDLSSLFQIDTGSPADVNAILAQAEEASLRHQLIMQRETQELRQVNSTLTRMTITDALTGVGNRKQFDMELPRMFSQAQSAGQCLAVIMIDADRFKNINDAHGHQAGDVVLIEMANRIRAQVAASGLVCRYGGEEFAVLLPNSDRRDGARMAECIRLAVGSTPIDIGAANSPAASLTATISLGVAAYEPCVAHRLSSHQLLTHAADRALYVAKNAGRNSVRVFSAQSQPVAA